MAEKQHHQSFPGVPNASQMNSNFGGDDDEFAQRAPPPSYEESQRMATNVSLPPQPVYQAPPLQAPPPQFGMLQNPAQQQVYGNAYGNVYQHQYYQTPPQMEPQQPHYYQQQRAQTYGVPLQGTPSVLTLHKGAEIRTTATGAVTIPPPPPGCAPTPAQMAAMLGQPVVVKKKNNSFF